MAALEIAAHVLNFLATIAGLGPSLPREPRVIAPIEWQHQDFATLVDLSVNEALARERALSQ